MKKKNNYFTCCSGRVVESLHSAKKGRGGGFVIRSLQFVIMRENKSERLSAFFAKSGASNGFSVEIKIRCQRPQASAIQVGKSQRQTNRIIDWGKKYPNNYQIKLWIIVLIYHLSRSIIFWGDLQRDLFTRGGNISVAGCGSEWQTFNDDIRLFPEHYTKRRLALRTYWLPRIIWIPKQSSEPALLLARLFINQTFSESGRANSARKMSPHATLCISPTPKWPGVVPFCQTLV